MTDRIITRPDFDGVVCAVLLKEALGNHLPVLWTQPNDMQHGLVQVQEGDIIANLPISGNCALWFDHHVSNKVKEAPEGLFRIAPSAAGLVYEYFEDKFSNRFEELVRQTDKIDDAQLELDEIIHPEKYPYILLSMTIGGTMPEETAFCEHLVTLLQSQPIEKIIEDPEVARRCQQVVQENIAYRGHLENHTTVQEEVSITDFRNIHPVPNGNRFLIYSLFPQTVVNVKTFNENNKTAIKVGHSITNRQCNVNVGLLLAEFGGGGHRGAGACRVDLEQADDCLDQIVSLLALNKPID